MRIKKFELSDYDSVINFLIELNKEAPATINWNWARFEWMLGHPATDLSLINSIGLWFDCNKLVGLVTYDMYYGEASVLVLPKYQELYHEILQYAYDVMKDDLGVAIFDNNNYQINEALKLGFHKTESVENIMYFDLDNDLNIDFKNGISFKEIDPKDDYDDFGFLMWQGFNHGNNYEEYINSDDAKLSDFIRPNFKKELSLVALDNQKYVAYCSLWFKEGTDYAYLEPVCCIPEYRMKGITKALIFEGFRRAKQMGAKTIYVESDMEFYKKLGFKHQYHYDFYWKK